MRVWGRHAGLLAGLVLFLAARAVGAVTPLLEISGSPDVSVDLSGTLVDGDEVAVDDLDGSTAALDFPGPISGGADVAAYAALPGGEALLAFESAVVLPGSPSPITARVGDVVRLQGSVYTFEFQAALAGLPAGTMADAVGVSFGDLLLSFDTAVDIGGGVVANDEDLVRWNGVDLALFLDGSAFGVAAGLDLDAVHLVEANGMLLLSFDGGGELSGVPFSDEDVLELDTASGSWQLARDGSAGHAGWSPADLDALSVLSDADDDGLADIVETDTGVFVSADNTGTDPLVFDSDGDGVGDGEEVALGSDPNDAGSTPATALPSLGPIGLSVLVLLLTLAGAPGLRRLRARRKP